MNGIMINECSFGKIIINGKSYKTDVLIFPDGNVVDSWWRKNGHALSLEDIRPLINSGPEIIIAGCGINGMMKPEPGLERELRKLGISFMSMKNQEALEEYNKMISSNKIAAGFHLTC
jgi:hypothetical protein